MSLEQLTTWARDVGFPRASGDEPTRAQSEDTGEAFSPRERG